MSHHKFFRKDSSSPSFSLDASEANMAKIKTIEKNHGLSVALKEILKRGGENTGHSYGKYGVSGLMCTWQCYTMY